MNEIEKILKDNMEDYESVKRQALKFIHENKKELPKTMPTQRYAGIRWMLPIFFLIDEKSLAVT